MRIVWDVSPLSHPPTGIGNYVRGSLAGVHEAAAGRHELLAFAPTSLRGPARIRAALAGVDVPTRLLPLPASHAVRTAWSLLGAPPAEWLAGRLDVLHFTDWMTPPQRGGLRSTTIHDLVPHHHPEWCTPRTVAMHRRKDTDAARRCDVVVTNGAYTAADVEETLGIAGDRIVVAHPGVDARFEPHGERAALGGPYVLGLGTLEPRKNLGALVAARRWLDEGLTVAVAGGAGWGDGAPQGGVRLLGYVPDADVPRLLRGAEAFVYPSRFEGFGMPVVEAMACGTPVVASSHPSLDEACGDAALRADPDDPEAIAAAVGEAIARRAELVPRGLAHAARFTWRGAGEAILGAWEARR